MKQVWPPLERNTPKSQAIRVSHDVDSPSLCTNMPLRRIIRGAAGDILKRHNFARAIHVPWLWLKSRRFIPSDDPYNTFDFIMKVSERHGLTSAFYFMCGRTHPDFDVKYEVEHRAICRLLRHIHSRGHEIGLHPSYNTYKDPRSIAFETEQFRRVCEEEGIRQA